MSLWHARIPQEFRDDVVRVARNRENGGVTLEQIAADFGGLSGHTVELDAPG